MCFRCGPLAGRYLNRIPVLTGELVFMQTEVPELTQLPYALRNRACAYRKVRLLLVVDFD